MIKPKIRFKNFSDSYENSKLELLFSERRERSSLGELISVTKNDGVVKASTIDRKDNSSKDKSNYKVVKVGDIAYNSMRMWQGASGVSSYDGILSPAYTVLSPNIDIDVNYFSRLFKTDKMINQFQVNSQGLTSDTWNLKYPLLKEIKVNYPFLPEQTAIGQLFSTLDDLLSAHKDNLSNYQSFKSTMLSKMFPKHGQTIPEIRLAGFDGEWERTKLGALGSVAMNKRIFKDETSEDGEIPFYKIGTFGGVADSSISRARFEEYKQKYPYPEIGDILISASGSIGRTVEYMGEEAYYQDSNIVWLKHDNRLVNSFLKQFYSIVKWNGIEGTTIKRLYNKNILETEISLPSLEEQQAIGELFSNLDDLISSTQSKIEELETLKKKLLQEMFV